MNKKNNVLIAILMLFSPLLSFAAQGANANRYDAIVKAFDADKKALHAGFAASANDISIVDEHKKDLESKLIVKKKAFAPLLFNLSGWLALVSTAVSGVLATIGAIGSYNILTPERLKVNEPRDLLFTGYRTFSYFELLELMYTRVFPVNFGLIDVPHSSAFGAEVESKRIKETFNRIPESQSPIIELGIVAPVLATASLPLAAIARYLFNKAASYKNEVASLEREIGRDEAIILALQALKNR